MPLYDLFASLQSTLSFSTNIAHIINARMTTITQTPSKPINRPSKSHPHHYDRHPNTQKDTMFEAKKALHLYQMMCLAEQIDFLSAEDLLDAKEKLLAEEAQDRLSRGLDTWKKQTVPKYRSHVDRQDKPKPNVSQKPPFLTNIGYKEATPPTTSPQEQLLDRLTKSVAFLQHNVDLAIVQAYYPLPYVADANQDMSGNAAANPNGIQSKPIYGQQLTPHFDSQQSHGTKIFLPAVLAQALQIVKSNVRQAALQISQLLEASKTIQTNQDWTVIDVDESTINRIVAAMRGAVCTNQPSAIEVDLREIQPSPRASSDALLSSRISNDQQHVDLIHNKQTASNISFGDFK